MWTITDLANCDSGFVLFAFGIIADDIAPNARSREENSFFDESPYSTFRDSTISCSIAMGS
jgi:hypothetical protein